MEPWEWVRRTERTVTKEFTMLGREEADGSWRNCGGKERNRLDPGCPERADLGC